MAVYIGENIKKLRIEKGLTQEKLADFLGVAFQSVSRWERGESYPDITLLPAISAFFNTTADELLGIGTVRNEEKIKEYIELYNTMKMVDMPLLFEKFQKASKEFPGDFRILVRYMELLQEERLFKHSDDRKKVSEEISRIYEKIQKHCTDDSIRIWSKRIMISHLMWKYDCLCNDEGKYHVFDEYLRQAEEIVATLPSLCDSRELMLISDKSNYYEVNKKALEELIFQLHSVLFGYCLNRAHEERITQHKALQSLLELIYPDGSFGKNSFNRLYNFGHLGHLYHQSGNDKAALDYLKKAAEYAAELDKSPDEREKIKRFYNYGPAYREMSACEFMKTVMTEHYPLSEEFKSSKEFKDVITSLN